VGSRHLSEALPDWIGAHVDALTVWPQPLKSGLAFPFALGVIKLVRLARGSADAIGEIDKIVTDSCRVI
jgi:hypothetical protein